MKHKLQNFKERTAYILYFSKPKSNIIEEEINEKDDSSDNDINDINYDDVNNNKNEIIDNANEIIDNEVQFSNYNLINNYNINEKQELEKQHDVVYAKLIDEILNKNITNKAADNFTDNGIEELYTKNQHKEIKYMLLNMNLLSPTEEVINECITYIKRKFYYINISKDAIKYLSEYFQLRNKLDNVK